MHRDVNREEEEEEEKEEKEERWTCKHAQIPQGDKQTNATDTFNTSRFDKPAQSYKMRMLRSSSTVF